MLPLPAPRLRLVLAAFCALAGLAGLAPPARAFDLAIEAPRARDGYVWIDARITDPFTTRVAQSLARGMPATLDIHAEMWRRRSGWFHHLQSSFDAGIRMRYEVWNESYRLERAGDAPIVVGTLDSLSAVLSRPIAIPVGRLVGLQSGPDYYVVVTVTLRPLTVEDVQEVEGWLGGEVEEKRHSGFGVITALPRSVFDAVRNFAGFGDQKVRAYSEDFELDDLTRSR
ncbi:MAG TPA: DUF4390 domain-containing protein [Candidatus Eisenbacteria bacterium]